MVINMIEMKDEIKEKLLKLIKLYTQYKGTNSLELKKEIISLGREVYKDILKEIIDEDDETFYDFITLACEFLINESIKRKSLEYVV